MPNDLVDELQSMSFGSSERSGSSTVSTASASCSSSSGPLPKTNISTADPLLNAMKRLRSDSALSQSNPIAISDLRFIQRLGAGDIGSVYLAELRSVEARGYVMAAKVMDKKELKGRNKEGRAMTEKEILEIIDHPFLPKLYGVAENERWFCLLTEFCPGGDLHVLRQRQPNRRFSEAAVRFYAAEVVVALEYIHMMDIVYRDLKPENVLVRSDGHIMLTDFDLSLKSDPTAPTPAHVISDPSSIPLTSSNFSTSSCILPNCIIPKVSCFQYPKRRQQHKRKTFSIRRGGGSNSATTSLDLEFVAEPVDLRSMSFVGTHEYLAPEIVSGEGHGSAVDWWTLGIFIYELLYGVTPFKAHDNEMILANIVARALEFPKEPAVSSSVKDLITSLLIKEPSRRLGSTIGATAIKRHSFFGGVNWALLRCEKPPYVPPRFTIASSDSNNGSRDVSIDSCPGSPVEYY